MDDLWLNSDFTPIWVVYLQNKIKLDFNTSSCNIQSVRFDLILIWCSETEENCKTRATFLSLKG